MLRKTNLHIDCMQFSVISVRCYVVNYFIRLIGNRLDYQSPFGGKVAQHTMYTVQVLVRQTFWTCIDIDVVRPRGTDLDFGTSVFYFIYLFIYLFFISLNGIFYGFTFKVFSEKLSIHQASSRFILYHWRRTLARSTLHILIIIFLFFARATIPAAAATFRAWRWGMGIIRF